MKLATPSQMKKIDALAIEQFQIPGILLMDNAARHVAEKAQDMLGRKGIHHKIIVVAGKGNNGGDAFATARYLHQNGYLVTVYLLVPPEEISGDAAVFLHIIEKLGIEVVFTYDIEQIKESFCPEQADLIIDGIFGTGIRGSVSGFHAKVIEVINQSGVRILSIDIPSGVCGETGQVCGVAVKADETVSFSLPKPGLCQYPGKFHTGNLTIADIGIPPSAIAQAELCGELLDENIASGYLPQRPIDGHKGTFGKLLIITGSTGMTGSGTLSARAAFKTGSGLVYLAVPGTLAHIYGTVIPEAITIPMADEAGVITKQNLKTLRELSKTMDAVVIGPGLSANGQVTQWVNDFIAECTKPMVIDADALNALLPEILPGRKAPVVLTPHPGEFSRLTGIPTEEIQKSRVEAALRYSRLWNATIVLKGAGSVIAYPDGRFCINITGHSGMAVAGSGDVLSGMIGSLLGQRIPSEQAAALAVYLHGKCGERLAQKNKGQAGFLASELCNEIPAAVGELSGHNTDTPVVKEIERTI